MIAALVLAANILALAGTYLLWDLGAWWREKYQAGKFKTIAGAALAHAGIVASYVFIMINVLRAF